MTSIPAGDPHPLIGIQRTLGRCLLRVQLYERQLKALIVHHDFSGPAEEIETRLQRRRDQVATWTLGRLVRELKEIGVVRDEMPDGAEDPPDWPETGAAVHMRLGLVVPKAEAEAILSDMKDLVRIRNDLVHHFLRDHDLRSPEGQALAQAALDDCMGKIDGRLKILTEIAAGIDQGRRAAVEALASDLIRDLLVEDPWPAGRLGRSQARVVAALTAATGALAQDGWTSIREAGEWMAATHPLLIPKKYGCGDWVDLVMRSGRFEINVTVPPDRDKLRFRRLAPG